MKSAAILTSLGLLFCVTGCVPSVHPLYTEQDVIFEPMLIGAWADKDGKETWTFTKSGDKEYRVLYVDENGKKGDFVAHLVKVAERRFLDLYPGDPDLQQNDFYKCHLLPVHTFVRIQQQDDSLQMASLKPDWVKKLLQENPGAVKHEQVDDSILLTASPKELQAFLSKHDKTPDAWDDCTPMTRRIEAPKQ